MDESAGQAACRLSPGIPERGIPPDILDRGLRPGSSVRRREQSRLSLDPDADRAPLIVRLADDGDAAACTIGQATHGIRQQLRVRRGSIGAWCRARHPDPAEPSGQRRQDAIPGT